MHASIAWPLSLSLSPSLSLTLSISLSPSSLSPSLSLSHTSLSPCYFSPAMLLSLGECFLARPQLTQCCVAAYIAFPTACASSRSLMFIKAAKIAWWVRRNWRRSTRDTSSLSRSLALFSISRSLLSLSLSSIKSPLSISLKHQSRPDGEKSSGRKAVCETKAAKPTGLVRRMG